MYLLFDIGGTKTRFAYTQDLKSFVDQPTIFYTKPDYNNELEEIKKSLTKDSIERCVGGMPGIINEGKLTFAPNLPGYIGKNISEDLKTLFNTQIVEVKNDAQMAALGEASFGAGKGYKNICYLTFGTGVGGGIVSNNKLLETQFFEPGHSIANIQENITFEESISGAAIRKKFNGNVPAIEDREFWSSIEKTLAVLISNIFVVNPVDIFVLGGGIVTKGNINIENVKFEYSKFSRIKQIPEIKPSQLADYSGLYGAMEWINQNA